MASEISQLRGEQKDRKEKIRQYKETPRPAGVYQVLHRMTGHAHRHLARIGDCAARVRVATVNIALVADPGR